MIAQAELRFDVNGSGFVQAPVSLDIAKESEELLNAQGDPRIFAGDYLSITIKFAQIGKQARVIHRMPKATASGIETLTMNIDNSRAQCRRHLFNKCYWTMFGFDIILEN
jgi:hypothetical protein